MAQGAKGFICHAMCYHVAQVEKWYAYYLTIATRSLMIFHTPRTKLNEILKAMAKTVAAVPSTLSSKLGVTIFNLLTKEQFHLVH